MPAKTHETHREAVYAAIAAWRKRNPERYRLSIQRSKANDLARHPEKAKARLQLQSAVASGRIVKPSDCENCGTRTAKRLLHGHHGSYDKPLSVRWLCVPCHKEAHQPKALSLEDKRREYLAALSTLSKTPQVGELAEAPLQQAMTLPAVSSSTKRKTGASSPLGF
jgi:hypothetical protein